MEKKKHCTSDSPPPPRWLPQIHPWQLFGSTPPTKDGLAATGAAPMGGSAGGAKAASSTGAPPLSGGHSLEARLWADQRVT